VALTAHAMKDADQECMDAGMDDYLSKPIDKVRLIACLERWLGTPGSDERSLAAESQLAS
jgi:CheY-like chemotaxis protein